MALTRLFSHEEVDEVVVAAAAPALPRSSGGEVEWYADEYEGQLAVDVYQTKDAVVVRSTLAGVKPEDLDVTLNNDVITIRGRRVPEVEVAKEDYLYQECYWGGFSRSIVLPVEVKPMGVSATLKNGILTVVLPKVTKLKAQVSVRVDATEEE